MSLPPTSAIDRLFEQPQSFGFFQAMRLLDRWFELQGLHAADRLRFRNSISLAFPASEIEQLHRLDDADGQPRVEITPAFMGLLGAAGPLPLYYTERFAANELERTRQRQPESDRARAFLDQFTHRALLLFYEAWRKHRLVLQDERDRRGRFLPLVLSLAGLGPPTLQDRLQAPKGGVADATLGYFAGVLRQRPVSAVAIRRVLAQYFKVPVRLDPFVGRWFTLPAANQSQLGLPNLQLGSNAVVGERVWQRDLRLRLTLGPMRRAKYRRFLPGGPGELALRELLTLMTGVSLEYEVRLTLHADDVQPAQLDAEQGPRLGWDGFLVTRAVDADRSDAGYDIHAVA